MKCIILFQIFTSYACCGQVSQIDSNLKVKADSYLNFRLGKTFKEKDLEFQFINESGISIAVYKVESKKLVAGKNMMLVYFKYMFTIYWENWAYKKRIG